MGIVNTMTSVFMRIPRIFADAINLAYFHGEQFIKPEFLKELDTSQTLYERNQGKNKSVNLENIRDLIKVYVENGCENKKGVALGIENQTHVDNTMPFRIGLYDMLFYRNQNMQIRRELKERGLVSELVSGISSEARIMPVFDLVIFWSCEDWNGPRSLREVFSQSDVDPHFLKLIPDIPLTMIIPSELTQAQIDSLQSELRLVFQCIHDAKNKELLYQRILNDESFRDIDVLAAELINVVLKLKLKFQTKNTERSVNMCQAMVEILQDERNAGRQERQEEIDLLTERCKSAEARCESAEARCESAEARCESAEAARKSAEAELYILKREYENLKSQLAVVANMDVKNKE